MADIISWNPRIGISGDDRYDVPGATRLAGSKDSGDPARILFGTSAFASPPKISEINAATDLNAVIAEINRRNAIQGAAAVPYITSQAHVKTTDFTALNTKIAAIRTYDRVPAYTFSTISSNTPILGKHLAERRKALATEWLHVERKEFQGLYKEFSGGAWGAVNVGLVGGSGYYLGYPTTARNMRHLLSFDIPPGITIHAAELLIRCRAVGPYGSGTTTYCLIEPSPVGLYPADASDWTAINAGRQQTTFTESYPDTGTDRILTLSFVDQITPGSPYTLALLSQADWSAPGHYPVSVDSCVVEDTQSIDTVKSFLRLYV